MIYISRYMNMRLKNYLINLPKMKLNEIQFLPSFIKNPIPIGASNIYMGIDQSYYDHPEMINFIDYIYNMNNNISPFFNIVQYEFRPHKCMIERHYQMNIMNKIISYKPYPHKFIYFYQIDGDVEFKYKFPFNNPYIPKENDILSFDNCIPYIYNDKYHKFEIESPTIGILIMNIPKL